MARSAYCEQHGIAVHGGGSWISRHRANSMATGTVTLIPAKVVENGGSATMATLM